MIAAIYARKSTDQNRPDEEKSVTRQVELAGAFAAQQGWTVEAAHVYVDNAASGGAVPSALGGIGAGRIPTRRHVRAQILCEVHAM